MAAFNGLQRSAAGHVAMSDRDALIHVARTSLQDSLTVGGQTVWQVVAAGGSAQS